LQLQKQLDDEEKRTGDIVADMTRQYKSMKEELLQKQLGLESKVTDHKDTIKQMQEDCQRMRQEKDELEGAKNEEIKELKRRIDEMSSDFTEMLKETLEKMKERIELAN